MTSGIRRRRQPRFAGQAMLDDSLVRSPSRAATGVRVVEHVNFDSYLRGLRACDLLFVPDSPETAADRLSSYPGQAQLHRLARRSACVGVDTLCPEDLLALRSMCGSVLIRRMGAGSSTHFPGDAAIRRMEALGFRIFFEPGGNSSWTSGLRQRRLITLVEFSVSSALRLAEYPAITQAASFGPASTSGRSNRRKVVVLNLMQDFEVLRPLLRRCAQSEEWRDTRVAVTQLMAESHIWSAVETFLTEHGIEWFRSSEAVDTVNALGGDGALLLTASESSAPNHRFSHEVCRLASARTVKVTIQHGYECVGLRHHRAHDRAFPRGVRFASDYVLTWAGPDALPSLHPSDRGKCIPVGVVKTLAEEIASAPDGPHGEDSASLQETGLPGRVPFPVLIAENLHSTRFIDPARYKRFLDFILGVNGAGFAVTVRSHPADRMLEGGGKFDALSFLTGDLRVDDLRRFGIVVSPPSTILLDAALLGVPAAVWSEQVDFGDCQNYPGVPSVRDPSDFVELCNDDRTMQDLPEANYRWAADNVCAFNGAPQAWSRLNEIIRN